VIVLFSGDRRDEDERRATTREQGAEGDVRELQEGEHGHRRRGERGGGGGGERRGGQQGEGVVEERRAQSGYTRARREACEDCRRGEHGQQRRGRRLGESRGDAGGEEEE